MLVSLYKEEFQAKFTYRSYTTTWETAYLKTKTNPSVLHLAILLLPAEVQLGSGDSVDNIAIENIESVPSYFLRLLNNNNKKKTTFLVGGR